MSFSSRIAGFYKLSLAERRALLLKNLRLALKTQDEQDVQDAHDPLNDAEKTWDDGGLSARAADQIVENVLGTYSLPLGVALNAQINGVDRLIPMVVEEPSVIAAASNACKMIRAGGGFIATAEESLMIAQIELRDVPDAEKAKTSLLGRKSDLLQAATGALPGLVKRGGGPRDIEVREIADGHLVVHLLVDCCDAMGANLVNGAAETIGPLCAQIAEAKLGLRILSNLADRRLTHVEASVPHASLGQNGEDIAKQIEAASLFAERDPYRAATHNKGIMNGVDSVVLATGNDCRAVEAGAHAYAATSGTYRPLATWKNHADMLTGTLTLPLALGTVGGTLRVHKGARLSLALAQCTRARDLAFLAASAGLASNLAALRALGTEGIQRGHMALHARSVAIAAGAQDTEVEEVAATIARAQNVTLHGAKQALSQLRSLRS